MKRNPISMLATSVLVGMALSTGSIAAGSAEIDILRELDARARHRNGPTPHSISGVRRAKRAAAKRKNIRMHPRCRG